jgi:DNA-binding MarR family transcriptional regulator
VSEALIHPDEAEKAGSPFSLSRFLPYRIVALGQAMGQGLAAEYAEEFGLSIAEWRTLAVIGQYREDLASQVVAETPMDKATISRAVSSLADRGLVIRSPHEGDRRASLLRLTEKGQETFDRVAGRALAYERSLLQVLTPEERALFGTVLDKLAETARSGPDQL